MRADKSDALPISRQSIELLCRDALNQDSTQKMKYGRACRPDPEPIWEPLGSTGCFARETLIT